MLKILGAGQNYVEHALDGEESLVPYGLNSGDIPKSVMEHLILETLEQHRSLHDTGVPMQINPKKTHPVP